MLINNLKPASGSKKTKKRVGRGISAGQGKTCGRGHKGQKSRSGGTVRIGFEGGQLPLQKRIPTFGFRSRVGLTTSEVRLSELSGVEGGIVDIDTLKASSLINRNTKRARIFLSGTIDRAIAVKGIHVTSGAKTAIEAAGGSVET